MNALQQVTARAGEPILIGEETDKETKEFSKKFISVPHTVDCLQGKLAVVLSLSMFFYSWWLFKVKRVFIFLSNTYV